LHIIGEKRPLSNSSGRISCCKPGAKCQQSGATGDNWRISAPTALTNYGDALRKLVLIFAAAAAIMTAVALATPSRPRSPSGRPIPVGDIPGWHQVFADDFTTRVSLGHFRQAAARKWHAYPNGWLDTSRNGTNMTSKVVSIHDGVLDLYLHTENDVHLVAALVPKLPTMLYGRYAVRFKADPVPGYKVAWLLWPDSEAWPRDGEIDFPEGDLDGTIWAFAHHQDATWEGDKDSYATGRTPKTWHTAVIEWSPAQVRFVLDGVTIGRSTSRPPNTPMHWVLQTETALDGSQPADNAAGHVLIDWVVAYAPT
jgi:hypothetical protein